MPPVEKLPSELLNLSNWKLTLPSGKKGDPDEITQPALKRFTNKFCYADTSKGCVVFKAPCGGFTTSGSKYPRSELREMNGSALASWDISKGSHLMTWSASITNIPVVKPQVVVGQIHNDVDDLMFIRLTRTNLEISSKFFNATLDDNYKLGTRYTMSILAKDGKITVTYNNKKPIIFKPKASKTNYFKLGMYTQSNILKGDRAEAYGQVEIYSCSILHE